MLMALRLLTVLLMRKLAFETQHFALDRLELVKDILQLKLLLIALLAACALAFKFGMALIN